MFGDADDGDGGGETTMIEIPVSEKIANHQVRDLNLPPDVLIVMNVHKGKKKSQIIPVYSFFHVFLQRHKIRGKASETT